MYRALQSVIAVTIYLLQVGTDFRCSALTVLRVMAQRDCMHLFDEIMERGKATGTTLDALSVEFTLRLQDRIMPQVLKLKRRN